MLWDLGGQCLGRVFGEDVMSLPADSLPSSPNIHGEDHGALGDFLQHHYWGSSVSWGWEFRVRGREFPAGPRRLGSLNSILLKSRIYWMQPYPCFPVSVPKLSYAEHRTNHHITIVIKKRLSARLCVVMTTNKNRRHMPFRVNSNGHSLSQREKKRPSPPALYLDTVSLLPPWVQRE